MKIDKQVIETITWETPATSIIRDIEAVIINGELVSLKFSMTPPGSGRRQNFELNLRKTDQTVTAVRKLHEVFGDVLDFMDGKEIVRDEGNREGRKRRIQISDINTSTFGDKIEEK